MSSDPLWLDEAWRTFKDDLLTTDIANAFRNAVLFAASQPRPITGAMVEAAWAILHAQLDPDDPAVLREDVRAAIEAAEKARTK